MNRAQLVREKVTKLVPLLVRKNIKVTQRGVQAYVKTDTLTGDIQLINIPYIADDADDEFLAAIEGFLDHEVAHVLFTDFMVGSKANAEGLFNLWNIVEDARIEHAMAEMFKGSGFNLSKVGEFFLKNHTDKGLQKNAGKEAALSLLGMPAIRAWAGHKQFADYMADKWHLIENFQARVSTYAIKTLPHLTSSEDALVAAREIFKLMQEEKPEQPAQENKPEQKTGGDGETPEEQGNGPSDQDDAPKDDKQKPSKGEKSDKPDDKEKSDKSESGESDQTETDPESGEEGADGDQAETDPKQDGKKSKKGKKDKKKSDKSDDTDNQQDQENQSDTGDNESDDPAEEDAGAGDASDADAGDEAEGDQEQGQQSQGNEGMEDAQEGEQPESGDGERGDDDSGEPEESGGEQGNGKGKSGRDDQASSEEGGDDEGGQQGEGDDDAAGTGNNVDGSPTSQEPQLDDNGQVQDEATGEEYTSESETFIPPEQDNKFGDLANKVGGKLELGDLARPEGDYDEALAAILSMRSVKDSKAAPYLVYTKDYDVIEPLPEKHIRGVTQTHVQVMEDKVDHMLAPIQKSLERAIAARSAAVRTGGFRSGRLNAAALARLTTFNDPRAFTRKQESRTKDVAVGLLLDCSGSMNGKKIQVGSYACYGLSSVLERMGIKHEIMGFTTGNYLPDQMLHEQMKYNLKYSRHQSLYMPILKGFDERMTYDAKRRFAGLVEAKFLNCNVDGESVQVAATRLAQRRETRKILIVLSDGNPSGPGDPSAQRNHLKQVVQDVQKSGIDILGIGIMDDSPRVYYPKHVILNDLNELPATVIEEVRKLLLK